MAKLVVLTRNTFKTSSSSLVDQPEVDCRRPEAEKVAELCVGSGLFRELADGFAASSSASVDSRLPVTLCCAETGTGNGRNGNSWPSSSSSKHFRSSSSVDPISADELASFLVASADAENGNDVGGGTPPPAVVVVDCRTFLAFNTNHVAGAFSAPCGDRFSRKRLTQGRATVAELISDGPSADGDGLARETYRRLAETAAASPAGLFVAYDDNTVDLQSLQPSHPLRLLTTSLTGSGYRTKFLEGMGARRLHCIQHARP